MCCFQVLPGVSLSQRTGWSARSVLCGGILGEIVPRHVSMFPTSPAKLGMIWACSLWSVCEEWSCCSSFWSWLLRRESAVLAMFTKKVMLSFGCGLPRSIVWGSRSVSMSGEHGSCISCRLLTISFPNRRRDNCLQSLGKNDLEPIVGCETESVVKNHQYLLVVKCACVTGPVRG